MKTLPRSSKHQNGAAAAARSRLSTVDNGATIRGAEEEEAGEEAEEEESPDDEATEDESPEQAEPDEPSGEVSDDIGSVSLDDDIEAVLIDFESLARKSASDEIAENFSMLYEVADEIDIEAFAADVARLVKNYDNLLDIRGMLVDKSKDFIQKKYGDALADSLVDTLENVHDIDLEGSQSETINTDLQVPLAVGATTAGE